MAVKTKKKLKKITKEVRLLTSDFIDQDLNTACLRAFQLEISSGLRDRWTPDYGGETQSANVPIEAMKQFIRYHPRTAKGQSVGISHCDADSAREVLKRLAAKRKGRTSGFDPMLVRTLIKVNEVSGRSTTNLKTLLNITKKKVVRKDRTRIRQNADQYRAHLLAHLNSTPLPKTEARALSYARDKALLLILLYVPLRRTTLHLAQRSWYKNGVIQIPSSGIKTREDVGVPLPKVVIEALDAYLAMRKDSGPSLFTTNDGSPMQKANLYLTLYRRTQKILDIKQGLGIHTFRHILATTASRKIGAEATANLLIFSQKTLHECYDLADSEMRIQAALTKLENLK